MMYKTTHTAGFTLVEMIVAVGLFAVVMLVCVGALLSLVNANRKAQALQSVMNNLNIALDGMVRSVRQGSSYDGSQDCISNNTTGPNDCTGGSSVFAFQPYGDTSQPRWIYSFTQDANGIGRIYKSVSGTIAGLGPITAPEVSIDDMKFYVVGTTRPTPGSPDFVQPKVVIVIKGSAGVAGSPARTTFHIQATAVQRVLDL
ncbi:hypothetical protein A3H16_01795 [Candidatus Kaiserbacteria bacterium RIFCSPLOWO2_12_FULL_53_8]|uniref:Type II secretion system protein J n=2 Tax=Candidatus Kaiseribacteriota TaxID=1752734 RepID=A0A1F6CWC9_9BACT|nr:MAG: hypothetical protein A2851_04170 [Candidatus Kaiserbacteria bacterium RIFCSPHIGHO2_01_FULL_53_29]OGG91860.1 MAG: hypothetical protein A3H16_01795 [Candidatus Kaiserbacteria bacterium RIFCSPLOWO2_12_FULL_53_8]